MLSRFVPRQSARRASRAPRAPLPLVPRLFAGLLVVLSVLLAGCADPGAGTAPPGVTRTTVAATSSAAVSSGPSTASAPSWAKGMATVPASRLPVEAQRTLTLIDKGGPYPYTRDGIVFGNYEGLLPQHPRGYYHEYTVPTPDSRTRGARRLITGQGTEIYYTDDHYNSFRAVLR
ncbi:ribonuclease domain-containing protein [Streptomyces sp. LaPpAH-108]|uniref:ribonuclease domain-containing protein n=1 Tax=Streptomyces sp. LaPpAH-108 TaxID=1155714 RepID=UPI0003720A11|nr:ribonuclease domain-containing protein [Streptomyces sp. LaPpAH-108]